MEPVAWLAKTNDKPTSTAYILYTQTTYGSAECWPNTTSKLWPYHLGKYSTTFHQIRMHWDYVHLAFTAFLVNAAGFIVDKAFDSSNSESKSTTDI